MLRFPGLRLTWSVVCVVLSRGPLHAADVTATATPDRPAVRLSEPVRVTLAVEGPSPVRVELPQSVLDDPSAEVWRVRPDGPPAVADLPGGRQRWTRTFRADPYRPGDPLRLGFAPARVSAGPDARPADVAFPPVEVKVTTEVTDPSSAAVRPITGIEELPPPVAPPVEVPHWPWAVAGGVGGLAAAWWLRGRRPAPPLTPEEEARQALAEAAAALARGDDPAAVADRVASAVRRILARRHGLPAEARTTAELLAAGGPPEAAAVLDACDRARFAGRPAAADELAAAIVRAEQMTQSMGDQTM